MKNNINYEELKKIINEINIKLGSQFEYKDKEFYICTHKHLKKDKKNGEIPIFWQTNSSVADYDIYIATNVIKKEFRKPVLMHETLEAFLHGENSKELGGDVALKMAHTIATKYDEKYAKEILNNDLFREYITLREKLTEF